MGDSINVPCLGQWELAESLPDVRIRQERPLNLKPFMPAEIEDFSLEDRKRRGRWREACKGAI
jgi:hypothetical protein